METSKKKNHMGRTLQTAQEAAYFPKKAIKNALKAMEEERPIGWSMVTWYQGELICKAMGMGNVVSRRLRRLLHAHQEGQTLSECM